MEKSNHVPINKKWLALSFLSFIGFAVFATGVATKASILNTFDQQITDWIRGTITTTKSAFFIPITEFGSTKMLIFLAIVAVLILMLIKKDKKNSLWLVFNLAIGAGLLNSIAKHIFLRPRPTIQHLVEQGGYSFPSGHSMGSLIFYSSLVFILLHYLPTKFLKGWMILFGILLILSIGVSRIYVGVHFPSDVVGGFCLAISWMSVSIAYYPRLFN